MYIDKQPTPTTINIFTIHRYQIVKLSWREDVQLGNSADSICNELLGVYIFS